MKGVKSTKYYQLERTYRQKLGRSNRLSKMIEIRNEQLRPLLDQVRILKKNLKPLEDELDILKKELKELIEVNDWSPSIIVTTTRISGKYPYYRGKIRFGDKEKIKMVPRKVENRIKRDLKSRNEKLLKNGKPEYTEIEKDTFIRNHIKDWVLDWWREEGILKRK